MGKCSEAALLVKETKISESAAFNIVGLRHGYKGRQKDLEKLETKILKQDRFDHKYQAVAPIEPKSSLDLFGRIYTT